MRITVVTILPEMFTSVLQGGVLGRAIAAGLIEVELVDPRDFTVDRHRTVDDSPYGGGPGMVLKVEPLVAAIEAAVARTGGPSRRLLMSPAGAPLTQALVRALAEQPHLVLVCGRYEGIDERVAELAIDQEVSLGDFVLTGGELAAMAIVDAVARYVPGVLGEASSTDEESFSASLLEYPQYTRPAEFRGSEVPAILQGGNHGAIRAWRRARAIERTAERRPELLHQVDEVVREVAARTYVALVHYPVHDRSGAVVTSSVTNLDIHDIARSAATYGLAGYLVVTPVAAQADKVRRIMDSWPEQGGRTASIDHRIDALSLIGTAPSIEDAIAQVEETHGARPAVIGTSARPGEPGSRVGFEALLGQAARAGSRPMVLVFGTGWGLAPEALSKLDQVLAPVRGQPAFNHLSVRSAVAAILDRLFGSRYA
ncbi:MAG TPA: tRNA (guanosine(37)-N1)-methyltransferase TrmD [Kofleriaceae bacterium]|nr:tRNA (guanosine(37)-N1)-methyltransferase TrmD [Kofleriaceae bacterium]